MSSKWITDLAKNIAARQSFGYSSFVEAKDRVCHRNKSREKYIVFDRLSFCVYRHNLTNIEYHQFGIELRSLYNPPTNDYEKCRQEYEVLFFYYSKFKSALANYNIAKNERPDFILKRGKHSIGIEVTQLTTAYEKVMEKISSLFENGLSADELKEQAENWHGSKAENYRYYDIGDSGSVGTEGLYLDIIREMFVDQIVEKYNKYEKHIQDFDDFVILCDAKREQTITSEADADGIRNMLNEHSFSENFHVAILWYNNQLFCSEYQFGPS